MPLYYGDEEEKENASSGFHDHQELATVKKTPVGVLVGARVHSSQAGN